MLRRKLTRARTARPADDASPSGETAPTSQSLGTVDGVDGGIADLYADDSAALESWKDRLSEYVDGQGTLDALRLRPSSEPPWPAADNPMLGYLIERSIEVAQDGGIGAAVAWLAANSWFEGAIAERSRFIRLLDAD
jgi:hypothetical protein